MEELQKTNLLEVYDQFKKQVIFEDIYEDYIPQEVKDRAQEREYLFDAYMQSLQQGQQLDINQLVQLDYDGVNHQIYKVKFWDDHLHSSAKWVWNYEADFGPYSKIDPDLDCNRAMIHLGQLKQTIKDLYSSGQLIADKNTFQGRREKRQSSKQKPSTTGKRTKQKKAWETGVQPIQKELEFPEFQLPHLQNIELVIPLDPPRGYEDTHFYLEVKNIFFAMTKIKWLLLQEMKQVDLSPAVQEAIGLAKYESDHRDRLVRYFTDRARYVHFLKAVFYDSELDDLYRDMPWDQIGDELQADVNYALENMWKTSSDPSYTKNLSEEELKIKKYVRKIRLQIMDTVKYYGIESIQEALRSAEEIEKQLQTSKNPHKINRLFSQYIDRERADERFQNYGMEAKYRDANDLNAQWEGLSISVSENEEERESDKASLNLQRHLYPQKAIDPYQERPPTARPFPPQPERLRDSLPEEEDVIKKIDESTRKQLEEALSPLRKLAEENANRKSEEKKVHKKQVAQLLTSIQNTKIEVTGLNAKVQLGYAQLNNVKMKNKFIESKHFVEHLESQERDRPNQRIKDPELRRTDSDYEFDENEELGSVFADSNQLLENYLNKKFPIPKEFTEDMNREVFEQRRKVKKLVKHEMPPIRPFPKFLTTRQLSQTEDPELEATYEGDQIEKGSTGLDSIIGDEMLEENQEREFQLRNQMAAQANRIISQDEQRQSQEEKVEIDEEVIEQEQPQSQEEIIEQEEQQPDDEEEIVEQEEQQPEDEEEIVETVEQQSEYSGETVEPDEEMVEEEHYSSIQPSSISRDITSQKSSHRSSKKSSVKSSDKMEETKSKKSEEAKSKMSEETTNKTLEEVKSKQSEETKSKKIEEKKDKKGAVKKGKKALFKYNDLYDEFKHEIMEEVKEDFIPKDIMEEEQNEEIKKWQSTKIKPSKQLLNSGVPPDFFSKYYQHMLLEGFNKSDKCIRLEKWWNKYCQEQRAINESLFLEQNREKYKNNIEQARKAHHDKLAKFRHKLRNEEIHSLKLKYAIKFREEERAYQKFVKKEKSRLTTQARLQGVKPEDIEEYRNIVHEQEEGFRLFNELEQRIFNITGEKVDSAISQAQVKSFVEFKEERDRLEALEDPDKLRDWTGFKFDPPKIERLTFQQLMKLQLPDIVERGEELENWVNFYVRQNKLMSSPETSLPPNQDTLGKLFRLICFSRNAKSCEVDHVDAKLYEGYKIGQTSCWTPG